MQYPLVLNPFDDSDYDTLRQSIATGQLTMGPSVKEFEAAFAKKIGSKFAVMTNSGSSANLIATFSFLYRKHAALAHGDEVLVPAIGWSTTWSPLHHAGLKLKVIDVNPDTLNVDYESYANAITEKTKMLVTVSILGNPLEFTKIRDLCRLKNIILLEDNCESIGARVDNKWCGTFGDIGTFSFFYSHHISTIEGGMAVTDDQELYHLLLSLRAHGWTRELPNQTPVPGKNLNELRETYNFVVPGFNVRPLELSGALGLSQLSKLDEKLEVRKKNARLFQSMMQKHSEYFSVQQEKHGISSWYSFPLILKKSDSAARDRLFLHLKENGIESRMITGGCITLHPMAKFFKMAPVLPPVTAERIHQNGLFVANHAVEMTDMFKLLDHALTTFGDI